jgi:squalene synthase HpnC
MHAAISQDLKRFGPEAPAGGVPSLAEARAYCRRLARAHYENFPVATGFLPRRLRQHFCNVYAYCRWADDLGDETGGSQKALALLGWWRAQLAECYQGRAAHPVFVALRQTIEEHQIPSQPFTDLIEAFEQDQLVTEYETFDTLLCYCSKSAQPVGRLVLHLLGQAHEHNFRWSDAICTGLQLANFWQDLAQDHQRGRVYLPREDRQRFGYSDADLAGRVTNDAFVALMQFEVSRARDYLRPFSGPAMPELKRFPFRTQLAIDLFARGGLAILNRIERIGCRVWQQRPRLRPLDFAFMFVGAAARAAGRLLRAGAP